MHTGHSLPLTCQPDSSRGGISFPRCTLREAQLSGVLRVGQCTGHSLTCQPDRLWWPQVGKLHLTTR